MAKCKRLHITEFVRLQEAPEVYHGTFIDIPKGELDPAVGQFGIHAGSIAQTSHIKNSRGSKDGNKPFYVHNLWTEDDTKLRLPDLSDWSPEDIFTHAIKVLPTNVNALYKLYNTLVNNIREHIRNTSRREIPKFPPVNEHTVIDQIKNVLITYAKNKRLAYQALRVFLSEFGYNGIVYLNRYEGLTADEDTAIICSVNLKGDDYLKAGEYLNKDLYLKIKNKIGDRNVRDPEVPDSIFKELFPAAHDSYILFTPYGEIKKV